MFYVFSFNKAFVPMAWEPGGRLKECVVILSKVWAYAAKLSLGEKSSLPVSGPSRVAVLSNWAIMATELDPIFFVSEPCQVLSLLGERQGTCNWEISVNEHHDTALSDPFIQTL